MTSKRTIRIAVLVALGLVAFIFIARVRTVLTPFIIAGGIAYVTHPIVRALENRGVPRVLAILLMYAIFICAGFIIVSLVIPSLVTELEQVASLIPNQSEALEGSVRKVWGMLGQLGLSETAGELLTILRQRVETITARVAERLGELLLTLFNSVFNVLLALFLSFYFLKDREKIKSAAVAWLPKAWRHDLSELGTRVDRVVGGFLRSQLIVSLIIGVAVTVGLMLLGVQYALFLGLLAGLADMIPYFGPLVSAIPAIALALLQSPAKALWVIALLFVIQQLEGGVIGPKIVGDQVGLHPISIIFAILAGGEIFGFVGLFLAVPVAATVKTIFTYVGEKSVKPMK